MSRRGLIRGEWRHVKRLLNTYNAQKLFKHLDNLMWTLGDPSVIVVYIKGVKYLVGAGQMYPAYMNRW